MLPLALACSLAAACGASASSNGNQACTYVHRSLALYAKATQAADPATAASDRARALADLRLALPLASIAADTDGTWQPLSATLSETNRVPESNLVVALAAQCQGIAS